MAITTANTIKFSNVCLEIYGSASTSGRSLLGAHAAANGTFNGTYATLGATKTLLDFRGYTHTLPVTPPVVSVYYNPNGYDQTYSWPAVTGATGYKVYKSTVPALSPAGSYLLYLTLGSSTLSFTSNGYESGESWYFYVTALHAGGETGASNVVVHNDI